MKVLMLGWELPPHNSGGLGIACYHLCRSLSKSDVDIEFVLPYRADHDIDFMKITPALPQDVLSVQTAGIAYDSYRYLFQDGREEWHDLFSQQQMYEQAVARLSEERSFDIIHAHDWLTFRAALRAREKSGCPIILHVHSVESNRAGGEHGNPLVREIEGLCMHLADQVVAVSQFTKSAITHEYGVPESKIAVIHNAVDPHGLEPLEGDNAYHLLARLKTRGYKVVVNVGRLTVQKGLPNLLRAAREVVRHEPKTIFLIVGSGEQYQELIELAAELGIGQNVLFAGFQRGKRWRDAFAIADLFVLPSVAEPFGLTPLEAAGYGTPSLVSKQAGICEVLNSCLKVDFWDVNEMANQITAAVRSAPLRRQLLLGAELELWQQSWDQASEKIMRLYRQHSQTEVPA